MYKMIVCPHCNTINKANLEKLATTDANCGKCSAQLRANIADISSDKLQKIIQHAQLPVVVDAYASWCGPCKMYTPLFEQVAQELKTQADFFKLNTENNHSFSSQYNIRGVPTTLIFYQKKLVFNQSGVLDKKNLQQIVIDSTKKI